MTGPILANCTFLTPPRLEDASAIVLGHHETDLAPEGFVNPMADIATAERAIAETLAAWQDPALGHWGFAIRTSVEGPLLGWLEMQPFRVPESAIGIWLLRDARGQCHARRAVRLALAYAFDEHAIPRVWAQIRGNNDRSRRLFLPMGFDWDPDWQPPGSETIPPEEWKQAFSMTIEAWRQRPR